MNINRTPPAHSSRMAVTSLRRRTLSLMLAVLPILVQNSTAQDHLEPELGVINDDDSFARSIRTTLLKDAAKVYQARVVCIPFGKPAWSATLVTSGGSHAFDDENRDTQEYFVEFNTFGGPGGVPIEESRVINARLALDREIAESVQDVWYRMLRQVRYPDRTTGGGADGVTYHFSRFVQRGDPGVPWGRESGWIWSPSPTSRAGQLADLGTALKDFATGPDAERPRHQETIRAKARRLLDQLKTEGSKP